MRQRLNGISVSRSNGDEFGVNGGDKEKWQTPATDTGIGVQEMSQEKLSSLDLYSPCSCRLNVGSEILPSFIYKIYSLKK